MSNGSLARQRAVAANAPRERAQSGGDAAILAGLRDDALDGLAEGVPAAVVLERIAARIEKDIASAACRILVLNSRNETTVGRESPRIAEVGGAFAADDDPLQHCARGSATLRIDDFHAASRWLPHAARALTRGFRSCVVARFDAPDGGRGAIAIYGAEVGAESSARDALAEAVAIVAARVLRVERRHESDAADASRFRSLSSSIPGVVYQRLVSPQGDIRYTYISESAFDLFGVPAKQIVEDPEALFRHYDDDYRESFRQKLIEASRAMRPWDVEAKIIRPDGIVRHTHAIATPARLADGSVLWTGVILNADRIKAAEHAAALAEARTRATIVDSVSQGMVLFDRDDRLVIANKYFCDLYPDLAPLAKPGALYEDLVRAEYDVLKIARRDGDRESLAQRLRMRDEGGYISECRISDERWIMVSEHRTLDGGTVILHTDVSELKIRERRIHHLAYHDVLTGLPNRAAFLQKLGDDMTAARQASENIAVICLDLDGFKYVNDTLGHPAGDELLVEVARRIKTNMRDTDTAARLGGDEFAIVLNDNVSVEAVTGVCWRLLNALAEPVEVRGQQVVTTGSLGVAFALAGEEHDPHALMKNADLALYKSKSDGRNTFRFFEAEMDARAQERRILENDLRLAVDREELELFFQPLVDVYTEEVLGAEALVRWRHPRRGLVTPADFIALAEETGIIVRIGAWVLRRACAEAKLWPNAIRVAVNLSPAQFKDRDLIHNIKAILAETGLDPTRLELVVTESLLLRDTTANLATLTEIKALGVRVSMDDFGTGYSSLGNLRSFPFDKIKIDRSFVSDLERNPDSAAIVRAVLSLGRGLGMTTTAEGVETRDQLAYLRAEGCVEVQGYYFSEPRPAAEVAQMLRTGFPRTAANTRK